MYTAKQSFLDRIEGLKSTLTEGQSASTLTSIIPLNSPHNQKAKILRNGLAVTSFAFLEDFLKNRMGEILESVDHTANPFSAFSNEFKNSVTMQALESINNKASNLKRNGEDWLSFLQEETTKVASTGQVHYSFSKYSLGWSKSNVSTEDIPKWLKTLRIRGGWDSIKAVSQKAETSLISPGEIFRSIAQKRHSAAHDPNHEALLTDLIQFTNDAKVIALCFDSLISRSLKEINNSNLLVINGSKTEKISADNIEFRFVIKVSNVWKEYRDTTKRSLRNNTDLNQAIMDAQTRAIPRGEIVLIKDESNSIIDWVMP